MASTFFFLAVSLVTFAAAIPFNNMSSGPGVTTSKTDKYDGSILGDVRLSEGQLMEDRNGVIDTRLHWPNKTIPYEISNDFTISEKAFIVGVLAEMQLQIRCTQFVPRTSAHQDYIYITGQNTGCWSWVGRLGGRQELNLQRNGCVWSKTIQVQFLHALGFYGEQNRFDRDDFVTVQWGNIQSGAEHNFDKYSTSVIADYGCKFHYNSIMMLDAYAYSNNYQKTIVTKDPNAVIGQSQVMSACDIKRVRNMYKCDGV